jgi:hypothetical protein
MNTKLYGILLVVTITLAVGGILTLIPAPNASFPNVLGYRSLCTFAPAATLFCLLGAGITCVLRASLVKRASYAGGKPVFKAAPITVLVVVLGLAIASTVWFVDVKSQYTDATSAVTSTEG